MKGQDIWKSNGVLRVDLLNAMLLMGIIIGIVSGFLLAWWFARKGPPPEPFFLRFLRVENRSARLDTRHMLHELHRKVEGLSLQVKRIDLELQELRPKQTGKQEQVPETLEGLERCREVFRLSAKGLSPDDIAQELKMAQGEVELVLSLDKKPSWVIDSKYRLK